MEGLRGLGDLPFSLGIWGSAFAASLDEIFLKIAGSGLGFLDWHRGSLNITGECRGPALPPTSHTSFQHQGPGRGMRNDSEGSKGLRGPTAFSEVPRK